MNPQLNSPEIWWRILEDYERTPDSPYLCYASPLFSEFWSKPELRVELVEICMGKFPEVTSRIGLSLDESSLFFMGSPEKKRRMRFDFIYHMIELTTKNA
jgi:hypothetical protein